MEIIKPFSKEAFLGDAEIILIEHSAECLTQGEKSRIVAAVIITKKLPEGCASFLASLSILS